MTSIQTVMSVRSGPIVVTIVSFPPNKNNSEITYGFCSDDTGYPPPNIGVAPGTAAPVCGADGYKVALLAPNIPAK